MKGIHSTSSSLLIATVLLSTWALVSCDDSHSMMSEGAGNSRYHSAKCLALSARCSQDLSLKSGTCKVGLTPLQQSKQCLNRACAWCMLPGKSELFPCTSENLGYCRTTTLPAPTVSPVSVPIPSETTSGNCNWVSNGESGNSRIVIDVGTVSNPPDGWTAVSRNGSSGLIYEKQKNGGTDPPGSRGVFCFDVMPSVSGNYFFSAFSYAPKGAHNNDAWVSASPGIGLWQAGKLLRTTDSDEWIKAYQNDGPDNFGIDFKTVDGSGHRFVIPNVEEGKPFKVCVSGRSYKFELYRLILAICKGAVCTGRRFFGFQDWAFSQCVA